VYNLLAHSRLYLAVAFVRSFCMDNKGSISCIRCGICDFFIFIGKPLNRLLQVHYSQVPTLLFLK